jgi:hypothetical protein
MEPHVRKLDIQQPLQEYLPYDLLYVFKNSPNGSPAISHSAP